MTLRKIISGGQTGVDRAALDVALSLGLECGGWCPLGRRAEDGAIALRYPLKETESPEYPGRTEANVCDSDGTLILTEGKPDGGTALTVKLARRHKKFLFVYDFADPRDSVDTLAFPIELSPTQILNIAGPRESSCPGIYDKAFDFLHALLTVLSK